MTDTDIKADETVDLAMQQLDLRMSVLAEPGRLEELQQTGLLEELQQTGLLEELQQTGLLEADHPLDQLARVTAAVLDAPRSYITLVTDKAQLVPGLAAEDGAAVERSQPLSQSLCQFAIATGEPLMVNDGNQDQLVRHTDVVRNREVGAYAGIPLRTTAGHVLGTLCVIDPSPRFWQQEEIKLLHDLAAIATRDIQHRIDETHAAQVRDLTGRLARATLAAEDAVAPLVSVAEEQDEPQLQRYAALSRLRMEETVALAKQLSSALDYRPDGRTRAAVEADLVRTVQRAVRSTSAAAGTETLAVSAPACSILVQSDPLALERATTHLLVTALHYATTEEPGKVSLAVGEGEAELTLTAPAGNIPTAELARVVARFAATAAAPLAEEDDDGAAAIKVMRGGIVVDSGRVQARLSPDGLRFVSRWPLAER